MKILFIVNVYQFVNKKEDQVHFHLNHFSILGKRKIIINYNTTISDINYKLYKKDTKLLKIDGVSYEIYILLDETENYKVVDSFIPTECDELFVIPTELHQCNEKVKIKILKLGKKIIGNALKNKSL